MQGKLYLIPTPIGNLQDITLRAIETLKTVDLILAEDTRVSGRLLKHFGIDTLMQAHHVHNEHKTVDRFIQQIKQGINIGLITDAGTPAISDPGFLMVSTSIAHQIEVECLPGATAFVPALVNSGLPCNNFLFEGFLPIKKGRKTKLKSLKEQQRTMVFYESPHKLLKTLEDFKNYFGQNRIMSISRELTKMYEQTIRGTVDELIYHFEQKPPKGEFVLIVTGKK